MLNAYNAGDTVRLICTFTDWAPEGSVGAVIDPSSVYVSTYYENKTLIAANQATVKDAVGVYHFDWTLPLTPGNYVAEFNGSYHGETIVERVRVSVKFAA